MAGRLEGAAATGVAAHVESCRTCRELLAAVARTESVGRTSGAVVLPATQPGEAIGRYRIVHPVGSGAMGAVFEAHDPELARRVALKLVNVSPDRSELQTAGRMRVIREAQAMARVSHPNVIHVYEVGTHETCVFIAMELVNGPNLRVWLAEKRSSWREVVQIFEQAGAGLHAAHKAGLVHRDFKPDNVLVSRDGRVIVSDFGLARTTTTDDSSSRLAGASSHLAGAFAAPAVGNSGGTLATPLTHAGALLGTPAYMAPEQTASASVDERADVFAFSVALFEALYGHRPFAGDTLSQILAHARAGEIVPPPATTEVPPAVNRVVARGLRAAPDERWPSMSEMLDELHRAAGTAPRRPRVAVLAAAVCALAVLAGGAVLAARSPRRVSAPAGAAVHAEPGLAFHPKNAHRITFSEGCEISPRFSPDGKAIVYFAMGSDTHPVMLRALEETTARQMTPPKAYTFTPVFSPDGSTIAYKRWSRDRPLGLYLLPRTGEGRETSEGDAGLLAAGVGNPSWTPDGGSLWGEKTSAYVRVGATSGAVEETIPVPTGYHAGPILDLGDGRLVTVFPRFNGTTDGGVALIGKDRALTWLAHGDFEEALALTPDRRFALAVLAREGTEPELRALPLDGSPGTTLTGITARKGIAVSPDGRSLVWSTCKDYVGLGRVAADGKVEDLEPGGSWNDKFAAYLPGVDRLVVLSSRGGTKLEPWVVDPSRKEAPRRIAVGALEVTSVAASPDGLRVALTAPKVGIAVVPADGSAPPRPITNGPDDRAPSFRHDGKEVLFERPVPGGAASSILAASLDGAPPRTLVEGPAHLPTASPTDDRFVYFTVGDKGEMTAMLFDPKTGPRVLSAELPATTYTGAAMSLDGKRVTVIGGGTSLREVEIASGKITWHPHANESVESITYTPAGMFVTRVAWSGDLWLAEDAF